MPRRTIRLLGPALAGAVVLLLGGGAWAQNYVGAQRCKSCHPFAYAKWAAGPHAQSHASLTKKQRGEPKCNSCHTTASEKQQLAAEDIKGVHCETCHGPGKYYQAKYVMLDKELARAVGLLDPTEAHCKQCHTKDAPSIKPFDFATMWKVIDHSRAARRAWEEARKAAAAGGT